MRLTNLLRMLCLTVVIATLATPAHAHWQFPWNRAKPAAAPATSPAIEVPPPQSGGEITNVPAPTPPAPTPVPEAKAVDPLARLLTSATFVKHANESLAVAGGNDPAFSQCVQFGLNLGQELTAKPLLVAPSIPLPQLSPLTADKSCPLCLIAAKRKDLAMLQSDGLVTQIAAVNAQILEIKTRALDIVKRLNLACAPLANSEVNVVGQVMALFGG